MYPLIDYSEVMRGGSPLDGLADKGTFQRWIIFQILYYSIDIIDKGIGIQLSPGFENRSRKEILKQILENIKREINTPGGTIETAGRRWQLERIEIPDSPFSRKFVTDFKRNLQDLCNASFQANLKRSSDESFDEITDVCKKNKDVITDPKYLGTFMEYWNILTRYKPYNSRIEYILPFPSKNKELVPRVGDSVPRREESVPRVEESVPRLDPRIDTILTQIAQLNEWINYIQKIGRASCRERVSSPV